MVGSTTGLDDDALRQGSRHRSFLSAASRTCCGVGAGGPGIVQH